MGLKKTVDGNVVVISLEGNILAGGDASQIHETVHEELEQGNRYFVLDLSHVKLINSSGLGILIGALTAARNQDGDVRLAAVSEKVAHILEMMHLNKVFEMYETVDAAKASYLQA